LNPKIYKTGLDLKFMEIKRQIEEFTRGAVNVLGSESLESKLNEGRPLNIKFGVDPTAPDIHLGHTVPLQRLKGFQNYGHNVQLIIGDYTAMIGDPSGKSETRPMLTPEEIQHNLATYTTQVFKLLNPEKTELLYNSHWLGKFSGADMLKIGTKHSVQQLLQRRDFKNRIDSGSPLSVTELFYPLLVGYDSVHLKTDVEIGGTDQLFNFLASREMQKAYGLLEEVVITLPILEGLDGVKKMSKSLGNAIGVTEKPNEMYGKIMSVSDDLMWKYFDLLSDRTIEEISEMKSSGRNPMEYKMALASEIVEKYHGRNLARGAATYFEDVHRRRNIPEKLEKINLDYRPNLTIVDILRYSGRTKTNGEARRLIEGGGVRINGEKISDSNYAIKSDRDQTLQVGKKFYRELRFSKD
jgi:tyrosyl-tRNA synthetase